MEFSWTWDWDPIPRLPVGQSSTSTKRGCRSGTSILQGLTDGFPPRPYVVEAD